MAEPQPTRQYLFDEGQIRSIFVLSGVGAVALLVALLILASARPQGSFDPADETEYHATVERAAATLEGFEDLGDGRARLDIDRAMELVAERGVTSEVVQAAGVPAPNAVLGAQPGAPAGGPGGGPAEAGDAGGAEGPQEGAQGALPDGATVYANCQGCHQANGQGVPGAFPPLAGHAPDLLASDRSYLPEVLLYGLQGEIDVLGQSYNGVMPGWAASLSDEQIAAVLDFILTEWGNADALPDDFTPYTAEEVAAERGQDLSAGDVYEIRQGLDIPE